MADAFSSAWGEEAKEEPKEATSERSSSEYSALKDSLGEGLIKPGSPDSGAVKALQGALNEAMGGELTVDGKFGNDTEEAVRQFQERNGLTVDGIVGNDTRAALLGAEPAKSPEELKKVKEQSAQAGETEPMIFGDKLSAEEQAKVQEIAEELQTTPNDLMSVFAVETRGTFDPSIRANGSTNGAVGLIQFTEIAVTDMNKRRAAQGLEPISKDELAEMSFTEQIDHARDYLRDTFATRGVEGPVGREELYLAVFAPAAIDNADHDAIYSKSQSNYNSNKSLDTNNDGHITRAEIVNRVNEWYDRGMAALAS